MKFQGRVRVVDTIWSGRFGWAPCSGFGDFQGRPSDATGEIGVSTLDPQDPLWG